MTNNIEDAILSVQVLRAPAVEYQGLGEYFMQSLFLKMTGFQEQKCKCILWELACDDFEFRRDAYRGNGKYSVGECSKWEDKQKVVKGLLNQLEKMGIDVCAPTDTKKKRQYILLKKNMIHSTATSIERLYRSASFMQSYAIDFSLFETISKTINHEYILFHDICMFSAKKITFTKKEELSLIDMYGKYIYPHRNRCAHNILSYQENKPTMATMSSIEMMMNNYFLRFFVLCLIDEVMVHLYNVYCNNRHKLSFL